MNLKAIAVFNFLIFFTPILSLESSGQSCPSCIFNNIYTSTDTDVTTNAGRWSNGSTNSSTIAGFNTNRNFVWDPTNTVTIRGIVLSNNANLVLDKGNLGNTSAFNIVDGCIVVNSGSTLTLRFISELRDVTICVEDGGKIVFNTRNETRNDFTFDNVAIVLQPGGSIEFGEADIIIGSGGISIDGYLGTGCNDPNGNIKSTNPSSSTDVCNLFESAKILPVDFLTFNASRKQDGIVALKWSTAKEWENSHFEIERSIDGIKEFKKIGDVEGMGWKDSVTEYEFEDSNFSLRGGKYYYRLKQVDFDGNHSFSKVLSVIIPQQAISKGVWRGFPNPIRSGQIFSIDLTNPAAYQDEKFYIKLISPLAYNYILIGTDLVKISEELSALFERASLGVYIIEISWGNQIEHLKILKQ